MSHCNEMICQQVTLLGYAEWPKVADAVIEARGASCPPASISSMTAAPRSAVYLHTADKYHGLTYRPSKDQKVLEERAIMASQQPSAPW